MRRNDWTWAYWGLLGLSLMTGLALVGVVFWRLHRAFAAEDLTREALVDAWTLGLGALVMMLIAGWAYASRPAQQLPRGQDPLWD